MEKNREVRRWSVSSVNGIGLSRRPHRITSLRDSTEEKGQVEMRLRDGEQRVQKKDTEKSRDPEMRSQNKRKRLEKHAPRNNDNRKHNKDFQASAGTGTEESSAEESFGEEYFEDYYGKAVFSTSKLNHAYHEKITRSSSPVLRVADEILGVPVPRRARSGLVKRSNECWKSAAGGGFGQDKSHRRLLSFPLSRSINVPTRKKMKSVGRKAQIPKVSSELCSSVQDDIEIEVVEALFDLMKQSQSQSSRKIERTSDNKSTEKLDSICNDAVDDKHVCSSIISAKFAPEISDLEQEIKSCSGSLLYVGAETKNKGDEDSKDGGIVSSNEIKSHNNKEQMTLKGENSSLKLEKLSPNNTIVRDGLEQTREDKVGKGNDPEEENGESVNEDDVVTKEKASSTAELVGNKEVARFQIDLMAPPPMASSLDLDKDSLTEMKSQAMTNGELLMTGKRNEGKQTQKIDIKQAHARLDFEKPHKENFTSAYNRPQDRKDLAQTKLLPFPIAVAGWPGGYHPGYIATLQTTTPLDGSAKPSAQLQHLPFSLARPWPRKSTTHQHIARSIRDHQQLTKNCTMPFACSPTLHDSRTCNLNAAPQTSSLGNPLQGDLPADQVLACKSSEVPNLVDAAKTKQFIPQHASQQSPAGNLSEGPAIILPLGQHQAIGGPTSQSGPSKSAKATGKASSLNSSAGRPRVSPSLLLPSGATVSFSGSNLPANEAPPFMGILQNNVYPFSISSNGGIPLPIKAAEAARLPFFNASYHPSIFHVTQVQQQPSTSQPQSSCLHLSQLDSQATSTSSGSSSFHKRSHTQHQISSQTRVHHSLMQQQQAKKQHATASPSSGKFDKEMSRQDAAVVVNNRESGTQKASDSKSLANPVLPINVSLMSHGIADSHGGNHQLYLQQKGMEVTNPQATCTPALNFFSVSQNPAVFQMLPDVAKGGAQLLHAAQAGQCKNFHVVEGKSVITAASNVDDKTKTILGMSAAQSFNFSNLGSSNPSNSISNPQQQQQELIKLPQQHILQMEMKKATQAWAPTSTNITYSFAGGNLPHSNGIASQNLVQNVQFDLSSLWKDSSLATTSPIPPLANTSNASGLKSLAQLQQINLRHSQIAFSSCSDSATAFQGRQMVINSQPASSLVDVSPSNSSLLKNTRGSGSIETNPGGNKMRPTMAALPSQQTEISLNGPSPKSSPVCGRNVPSILGTCPSQLSEIKY